MNNIQQFLEEEMERFVVTDDIMFSNGFENHKDKWLKDHDTRLINFVLSEVEKEVEKMDAVDKHYQCTRCDKVSTVISNLRVK